MSKLPLNKAGNRRGMSAGSRKTQFRKVKDIVNTDPKKLTAQDRSAIIRSAKTKGARKVQQSIKRANIERAKAKLPTPCKQDFPHRRVQKMIDDVYRKDGKSIRKSLMGMAQTLNAPQETLLQIKNLSDTQLELVYNEDRYLFESYWEYPIYLGEDRSVTIDEIIARAS